MIDIILSLVILFLLVEGYLSQRATQQERKEWTKAMLAKDLRELTDNEALEKVPQKEPFIKPPDLVSMDDITEDNELFDKHMEAVKRQAKEDLKKELEI